MTFEELKFELLDRQRKKEINKLFHLYVKAESYGDVLRIVKSEGNFRWIFKNGFRDLIQYFPIEELENEGFYQREVSLTDTVTDIILLQGSSLTLDLSSKTRCRVIIDNANAVITVNDLAMVEVECYREGSARITNNDWSYSYVTARDESIISLWGNNKSTLYLDAYQNSKTYAYLQPESFLYSIINDNAVLNKN